MRPASRRWIEPNSSLGEAIAYMRNHWEALTLFLRQPGAPLDNNNCRIWAIILHLIVRNHLQKFS